MTDMLNRLHLVFLIFICQYAYAQEKTNWYADKVNINIWIDGVFFENDFKIKENKMTYTRPYTSFESSKSLLKKWNILRHRKTILNNDTAKRCISYAKELFFIQKKPIIKQVLLGGEVYDVPNIKITYYRNGVVVSEDNFNYSHIIAEYDEKFQFMFKFFDSLIANEMKYCWSYRKKRTKKK